MRCIRKPGQYSLQQKSNTEKVLCFFLTLICLLILFQPANAIEREFYIQAIEHKGKTNKSTEPFPSKPFADQTGMHVKKADANGNWAVEAYAFAPAQIAVELGDLVILHFIGVNGSEHNISIDGVKAVKIRRGETTTVRFTADTMGIISFLCFDHQPNMNGQIVVLPKTVRGSH